MAIDTIRKFRDLGECYACTSWGKDSTCIAHLTYISDVTIPIYSVVTRRTMPDCDKVRDEFLKTHPGANYHEIIEPPESWPHWGFGIKKIPIKRAINGVRKDESGMRKMSARVHGICTEKMCRPIIYWKGDHVFAYLYQRGLPVHPAYAMSFGGKRDRHRIRVGSIGGERGTEFGRAEWEKEYYPDIVNHIEFEKQKNEQLV